MGASGEGQMVTHQAKKMTEDALLACRDRFELPLTDEQVRAAEYYKPPDDSPEMRYLRECRETLGGSLPARRRGGDEPLEAPNLSLFSWRLEAAGARGVSAPLALGLGQAVGGGPGAGGDGRSRGFLLGGTDGRTTLNGEGLQHADGHSHVLFSVVPNVRAYDPAFGYEVAVIVQDGLRRMVGEQEDVFFYITLMNENYRHPPMPAGAEQGILRGLYLLREASGDRPRVQLLGSGNILIEVLAAADLL